MKLYFQQANDAHLKECLHMVKDFYRTDGYPFDEGKVTRCFTEMINNPDLGRIWMLTFEDQTIVGYLILTFGYSFEYSGRDAFIDELYFKPDYRNQGLGSNALSQLDTYADKLNVNAIHLEVETTNEAGNHLYQKMNYVGNNRRLLTKILKS